MTTPTKDDYHWTQLYLRRLKLAQLRRLLQKRHKARAWLDGDLRVLKCKCHCGREHHPVKSISGLEEQVHCPVTWYGRLVLWGNQEPPFTFEELMEKCKDGFEETDQ